MLSIKQQERKRANKRAWKKANIQKVRALNKLWAENNPQKVKDSNRKYNQNNRDHINKVRRAWRKKNWDKMKKEWDERNKNKSSQEIRKNNLKKYGLSPEQFDTLVLEQNGLCWICKKKPDRILEVDHCHVTKAVRKLLCGRCNKGLGLFLDDPDLLIAAAEYLRESKNENLINRE